jgi:hypothetical protein
MNCASLNWLMWFMNMENIVISWLDIVNSGSVVFHLDVCGRHDY